MDKVEIKIIAKVESIEVLNDKIYEFFDSLPNTNWIEIRIDKINN